MSQRISVIDAAEVPADPSQESMARRTMKRLLVTAMLIGAVSSLILNEKVNGQLPKASARPNFSGTWKLNIDKSKGLPPPIPQSLILKVDHRDPILNLTSIGVYAGNSSTDSHSWTTDGKEHDGGIQDAISRVGWDGPALLVEFTSDAGEGKLSKITERWTLSQDGKTLTMVIHINDPGAETSVIMVLDKQ